MFRQDLQNKLSLLTHGGAGVEGMDRYINYNRLNFFRTSATFSSVLLRVRKVSIREWSLLWFLAISPSISLTLSSKGLIIVRLSQRANHMVPPNIATNAASQQEKYSERRFYEISSCIDSDAHNYFYCYVK